MDERSPEADAEARKRAHQLFAQGALVTEVARELGVAATVAYRWRTTYLIESGQAAGVSDHERTELLQARRRIAELEQQLADARAELAQLESQLEVALHANRLLRDGHGRPTD